MAYRNNDRGRRYDRYAYIDGNVVRKAEAAPKYRPQTQPQKRRPQPQPQKSREQIARDKAKQRAARKNQQRALSMNVGYVAFLTVATMVCFAVCAMFIHVQSDITTRMSRVAALEMQIADLRADNEAAEKRLETIMNLDEVKAAASAMGLHYPTDEQIHYYNVENSDFMNQYEDIPSN